MQPISMRLRLNRSISIFILLAGLLSLPASQVSAAPPDLLASPKIGEYYVKFDQPGSKQICIGQEIMVHGEFGPGSPGTVPLAPLTGPTLVPLAPLVAVANIVFTANLGGISPQVITPGTNSGTFLFFFTANKTGPAIITASLSTTTGSVQRFGYAMDVTDKCQYLYKLYGEGNYLLTGNGEDPFKIVLQSKGLLTAPDASQPLKLEKKNAFVQLDLTYLNLHPAGCSYWNANAGGGNGFLDATSEPILDGFGIDLKLGQPQDFGNTVGAQAFCDGQLMAASLPFTLSSSKDPWIEQEFPADGGTFKVKIDYFDETVKAALSSGAAQASYTATLTLQRIEQP